MNKKYLTDTLSVNKKYLTDSVFPIEKKHLKGEGLIYGGLLWFIPTRKVEKV